MARSSRSRPPPTVPAAAAAAGSGTGWVGPSLPPDATAASQRPSASRPAAKRAQPGTLAADTRYYPMGTVIYIPGYGYGVVEDRGGDIKGRHRLDLFYQHPQGSPATGAAKKLQVRCFSAKGRLSCPKTPPRRDKTPAQAHFCRFLAWFWGRDAAPRRPRKHDKRTAWRAVPTFRSHSCSFAFIRGSRQELVG